MPCVCGIRAHALQRVDQIRAELITVLGNDRSHLFLVLCDAFRLGLQVLDHLLDGDVLAAVEHIPQAQPLAQRVLDTVVVILVGLPGRLQRSLLGSSCCFDLLLDVFLHRVADILEESLNAVGILFRDVFDPSERIAQEGQSLGVAFSLFCGVRRRLPEVLNRTVFFFRACDQVVLRVCRALVPLL